MPDNNGNRENEDIMILPEYPDVGIPEEIPGEGITASPYPDPNRPLPTPTLPSTPNRPETPSRPQAPNRPGTSVGPETPSRPGTSTGTGTDRWPPITVYPIPILPNPQENQRRYCTLRFLNGAVGYEEINISVGDHLAVRGLRYGEVTSYFIETAGFQNVRVTDATEQGRLLSVDPLFLRGNEAYTAVFVNGINGPSMYLITDYSCEERGQRTSCIRAVNLSYNSQALDVAVQKGEVRFEDLMFKTVPPYQRVLSGYQEFYVTDTISGLTVLEVRHQIEQDRAYTMYILGNAYGYPKLSAVFTEDYSRLG